jgi:hypothetical protein
MSIRLKQCWIYILHHSLHDGLTIRSITLYKVIISSQESQLKWYSLFCDDNIQPPINFLSQMKESLDLNYHQIIWNDNLCGFRYDSLTFLICSAKDLVKRLLVADLSKRWKHIMFKSWYQFLCAFSFIGLWEGFPNCTKNKVLELAIFNHVNSWTCVITIGTIATNCVVDWLGGKKKDGMSQRWCEGHKNACLLQFNRLE